MVVKNKLKLGISLILLLVMISVVSATDITTCGTHGAGDYNITSDITNTANSCLIFNAGSVTLNCQGYWINNTGAWAHTDAGITFSGTDIEFRNCNVHNYSLVSTGTGRVTGYNSTFLGTMSHNLANTATGHLLDEVTIQDVGVHYASMYFGSNTILNKCTFDNIGKPINLDTTMVNVTYNNTIFTNYYHNLYLGNGTEIWNSNISNVTTGYNTLFRITGDYTNMLIDNCIFTNITASEYIVYSSDDSSDTNGFLVRNSNFNSHEFFLPYSELTFINNNIYFNATTGNNFQNNQYWINNTFEGNNISIASSSAKYNVTLDGNLFTNFYSFRFAPNDGIIRNNIFNHSDLVIVTNNDSIIQDNLFINSTVDTLGGVLSGNTLSILDNEFYNHSKPYAINIEGQDHSIIDGNRFYNIEGTLIQLAESTNVSVANNICTNSTTATRGIYLKDSLTNVVVDNNFITNATYPIYVITSTTNNNYFLNNEVYGDASSIYWVRSGTNNNLFTNEYINIDLEINDANSNKFVELNVTEDVTFKTGAYSNAIYNSTILGAVTNADTAYNNSLVNCNVVGSITNSITAGATLNIKWYLTLDGTADIELYDNQDTLILDQVFTANTSVLTLPEYMLNGSTQTNYTPYTLVSYDGVYSENTTINLTESKTITLTPATISDESTCSALGKYWYNDYCWDTAQTDANESASDVSTTIFAAFGLFALISIVSAGFIIVKIFEGGNVGTTELMFVVVSIIGLGLVLLIGYYLIGTLVNYL